MPIKTYLFGLLPPTLNGKLVEDQMLLAHRYRNVLTEIEIERLGKVRAALGSHADVAAIDADIVTVSTAFEAARAAIKQARAATRSRSDTAEQRAAVRSLGANLRDLRVKRKAARDAIAHDPEVRAKIDEAEEHSRERVRQARKASGVYWGTYLLAEADADRARHSKRDPRFKRWTGDGRVSVQLQNGLSLDGLLAGEDTRVRIGGTPVDDGPTPAPFAWPNAKAKRLHLRVMSGPKQRPIWAEWPLIMSREIPAGSIVKVATVSRFRDGTVAPSESSPVGARWRWTLHLTVEVPETDRVAIAPDGGVVALNLGFCLRPGGIRSGYIVGDDGYEEEVLMPRRDIEALDKADHIRGVRDRDMDSMRAALGAWLAALTMPDWLKEQTHTMHAWRSPDRFRRFAFTWRNQRFPGDEAGYDVLETWRRRDLHLDQYEHGLRTTALRRRRETYRMVAARLARQYRTIVMDDTDLRNFQRTPDQGSSDQYIAPLKKQQRMAAGSELRAAMANAFWNRSETASSSWMTRTCASCGNTDLDWDTRSEGRDHTCPSCHAMWDRDANLCRNLLRERSRAATDIGQRSGCNDAISRATRQTRLRSRWKVDDRSKSTL